MINSRISTFFDLTEDILKLLQIIQDVLKIDIQRASFDFHMGSPFFILKLCVSLKLHTMNEVLISLSSIRSFAENANFRQVQRCVTYQTAFPPECH